MTATDPNRPSREVAHPPTAGLPMLLLGLALLFVGVPIALVLPGLGKLLVVAAFVGAILLFRGLVVVPPNHGKLVLLFGKYKGTLRQDGFFWVNPFTNRREVSLRAHNFNSDKLKVNDLRGNPIEIGAVVVWRVRDTAQAAFDVEDFASYVQVQTESALRHLAALHP
jgi:regulator of protease activity HflC (stomatin/prohibitin superfamily)